MPDAQAPAFTTASGHAAASQPLEACGPLGALRLGALGVVYGDIGTSPLYTLKTALEWAGGATPAVALGMFSLIVWTLIITTSVKYVALVMRADNDGEGSILALMARLALKGKLDQTRTLANGATPRCPMPSARQSKQAGTDVRRGACR